MHNKKLTVSSSTIVLLHVDLSLAPTRFRWEYTKFVNKNLIEYE